MFKFIVVLLIYKDKCANHYMESYIFKQGTFSCW